MANKVKVTPEQFAARWGTGLKGSIERIREGVERVAVAPGEAAAAAVDKWHSSISSATTRDKWARRVAAVSLPDWQRAMLQKGVNRISDGVDNATPKMVQYGTALIEHQNRLLTQLDQLPNVTLEDSIRRMTTWVRGMAQMEY